MYDFQRGTSTLASLATSCGSMSAVLPPSHVWSRGVCAQREWKSGRCQSQVSQDLARAASHPCMKGPDAGVQLERRVDTGWQGRVHPKQQRRRVVRLVLVADAESGKLAGISANPICPGPRFNESNLTPKTLRHIENIKERRKCRGQCGALPSLAARDSGLHGATGTLMFSRPDNRSQPSSHCSGRGCMAWTT